MSNYKINDIRDNLIYLVGQQQSLLTGMKELNITSDKDGILDENTIEKQVKILDEENEKLKELNVVLAVVGTMKAGKSTTINAIVGKKVLPENDNPMTTLPTFIKHSEKHEQPELKLNAVFFNQQLEKLRQKINTNAIDSDFSHKYKKAIDFIEAKKQIETAVCDEQTIYDYLDVVNQIPRLAQALNLEFPFSEIQKNIPEILVKFKGLKEDANRKGSLTLLDSPGPNEAGMKELKDILTEELNRSSAILTVVDFTSKGSDADNAVKELVESMPIDKKYQFIVVNKFDNCADEDKESKKEELKAYYQKLRLSSDNVYFTVAIDAVNAHIFNSLMNKDYPLNDLIQVIKNNKLSNLLKKMYGISWEKTIQKKDNDELIEDSSQVLDDSGIPLLTGKAIQSAYKKAELIAINSGLGKLKAIQSNLINYSAVNGGFCADKITSLNNQIKEFEQLIESSKKIITEVEDLKKLFTKKKMYEQLTIIQNSMNELLQNQQQEALDIFINEISRTISEQKEHLHSTKDFENANQHQKKVNKEAQEKEKFLDDFIISFNRGEEIILGKENSREKFSFLSPFLHEKNELSHNEEINKIANAAMNAVCKKLADEVNSEIEKFENGLKQQFQNVEQKCTQAVDAFKQKYQAENITLDFADFDLSSEAFSSKYKSNASFITKNDKPIPYTVTTNRFTRWLGEVFGTDWGQEERTKTETTFTISKKIIEEKLSGFIKNEIKEVEQHQTKYNAEVYAKLEHYSGKLSKTMDGINNEVNNLIKEKKANKNPGELEKQKEKIQQFIIKTKSHLDEIKTIEEFIFQNIN